MNEKEKKKEQRKQQMNEFLFCVLIWRKIQTHRICNIHLQCIFLKAEKRERQSERERHLSIYFITTKQFEFPLLLNFENLFREANAIIVHHAVPLRELFASPQRQKKGTFVYYFAWRSFDWLTCVELAAFTMRHSLLLDALR